MSTTLFEVMFRFFHSGSGGKWKFGGSILGCSSIHRQDAEPQIALNMW